MSNLFSQNSKLKAITINGAIHVESAEDIKKKEERRKQRKSRWDSKNSQKKDSNSGFLALPPPGGIKDNPHAIAESGITLASSIDTSKMSETQQQIYILQLQIREATRNLARPDLGK